MLTKKDKKPTKPAKKLTVKDLKKLKDKKGGIMATRNWQEDITYGKKYDEGEGL